MFQLIESIRIENKQIHHINLHNERFNAARHVLFGSNDFIRLEQFISIAPNLKNHRYKLRMLYDGKTIKNEISPYLQRSIKSLKLVEDNEIEYTYKTNQRELLNKAYEQRDNCDDVIIVKNNLITDAWFANVIFFDGHQWITPDSPLLKGVQRQFLLKQGRITEAKIRLDDLQKYKSVKLINALIDFERAPEIDLKAIQLPDSGMETKLF